MTLFAFGGKCGPIGDAMAAAARPTPSCQSSEPSARPAQPKPTSARNVRRCMCPQKWCRRSNGRSCRSADGDEVVVIEQGDHEVLPGTAGDVQPRLGIDVVQQLTLAGEEARRSIRLGRGRWAAEDLLERGV